MNMANASKHTVKKHALIYKMLGNPKRLEILYRLCEGECSLKELEEMLGARKTNAVQHLGLMRLAGIVRVRYLNNQALYSIIDPRIVAHRKMLELLDL
ncbi:hypothetical protein A3B21_03725 [Candidatus Uhrbacteria bacterium RIFCSPLOWO2_01_FULL_47_24]|uniref:HTH arsR-type domain-containing protein n=1 Tax=Candidatus Uhrbacteria bacterium RIFCSPLOWO2_01_FULL_47_24 TaxID=1802401 RepID=A0A1F7URG1_9BACT|nr:MAG: hypothetical protein A2753_01450 [Candidatus Uhrbacteria bacterium RIFCSPHIGHO2_01_FULL_47_11]OGL68541.1 MAG: hypothetical protein A3D58_02325 [Candidatus Uhrbacteria bacterium RIFCSPHIGHO2_02_FULL_46_47]OGL75478.1 MAG: hypothetical protein A3F52_04200 [Candidatus Uhrbacteria bacterium RIFCSPHIGHO2_12_FULL_47_11]OGL80849.1 MAG: hypothetical protein A3B21_03725 [Candidatus Uhrbacteria bacterium RIFCSPLOWO2_01_FULL_47_24]OGL84747.1 MAG: hypothetical protein A3J03_01080 [Candidatus Uhrbact